MAEEAKVYPMLCVTCGTAFETQEKLKEHEMEVHKKRTTQDVSGSVRGDNAAALSKELADTKKELAAANAEIADLGREITKLRKRT